MEKLTKQLEILKTTMQAAVSVIDQVKTLPKGKTSKNIFLKSYNRRPMKKQKAAKVFSNIGIVTYVTAAEIHGIASRPLPKFNKGGLATV